MSNVTTLHLSEPVLKQRLIAADLIAQSKETREKRAKFAQCFAELESTIEALNGAKRHGYRMRFRRLQRELKAALEELVLLEKQLCDVRRYVARQAVAETKGPLSPAFFELSEVARQNSISSFE
ncbi:hypothetical protein IVB41_17135 [Bradyrhizobium sp. 44]|uniref:hypothetical protein n=1 Tax=Bradyrhizobium sp. 44 TaxID=2782675 RepID=UPI001FFBE3A5|nr:hypothetical protein [Bradyrhizobium sp. 44]MCK1285647.1 hypothetical protein [Bradyrhizobium sp. 44]